MTKRANAVDGSEAKQRPPVQDHDREEQVRQLARLGAAMPRLVGR